MDVAELQDPQVIEIGGKIRNLAVGKFLADHQQARELHDENILARAGRVALAEARAGRGANWRRAPSHRV